VAAVEVLIATAGVREALKDPVKTVELRRYMGDGRKQLGSQTFDQHLAELVEAGLITPETAKAALSMTGPGPSPSKKGTRQAASA